MCTHTHNTSTTQYNSTLINMEAKHDSEELAEWQQVHFPFSTVSAKGVVGEENSSVFPPRNHEDLQITDAVDGHQQLQEDEPSPSPRGADGVRRWMRLHVGAFQTEILRIFGRLRSSVTCKVGVWSFAWIAGGVAAVFLVSFWRRRLLMWRQRQLQLDSSKKSLMALLDEKDKKINQVLLQIAQMNDMLLARRTVRVIRVK